MFKPIFRLLLRLAGWKSEGKPPELDKYVLIAAPHTSNWDFVLLLVYAYLNDVPLKWMGKDSIFKGPFAPILRAMGGLPIDRSSRHNTVTRMAEVIRQQERIVVSVPPEGTRRKVEYWKTGFYYLACEAGVPLVLSYINGPERRFGVGPVVHLTGDIHADMQTISAFYAPIKGIRPEKTSLPRVKPPEEMPASKP